MKVAVGSKNPVKITCVQLAFQHIWPAKDWTVLGIDVKSGVSDQPMSDDESIRGARTRAQAALTTLQADFGVGLEGGLQQIGDQWFDCGWVAVIDTQGRIGIGSTIKIETPEKLMKLIREGKELGIANDIVSNSTNSKHGDGHFGLMTNNAITRTSGYRDGVIAALARFIQSSVIEL